MTQSEIHDYLLTYPEVWVDTALEDGALLYKIGREEGKESLFAVIQDGTHPVRLSLRCDPQLALILRDKYETVLPGMNLSKKSWNTILCTGQVPEDELQDFVRLSYQIALTNSQGE